MYRKTLIIGLTLLFLVAGCIPVGQIEVGIEPTATVTPVDITPEPTDVPELAEPTTAPADEATEIVESTATSAPTTIIEPTAAVPTDIPPSPTPALGPEKILILSPGPGSRLTSPLTVSGEADSTFEQNLVIRLLSDDGTELALVATTIQAELGQRGPFEAQLDFTVYGDQQAFIQVFSTSPRDGGVTHLASVGVMLTDVGPEAINPPFVTHEWIRIDTPVLTQELSPGTVHVAGFGYASFEGTLLIELLDTDGNVIAGAPVIIQAPDIGHPGAFEVDLELPPGYAGPGRVVVRDISPAHGEDSHLVSVEVTYVEP